MNIEQSFIKTNEIEKIECIIRERLINNPDKPENQPDYKLPSSYDILIAKNEKRKIALSEIKNGWVSILESKEVNDYALLKKISLELNCEICAIVLSEVTGHCGYSIFTKEKIDKSFFSKYSKDPILIIKNILKVKNIIIPLYMFKEIASKTVSGWKIFSK